MGFIVGLLVIVLAVGGLVTSSGAFCGVCHEMRPYARSLGQGAHKNVDCYACHLESGWESWPSQKYDEITRMYPAALLGRKLAVPGPRVSRQACLDCHAGVRTGIQQANGLRIAHRFCAPSPVLCDQCHGTTAHGDTSRWPRTYAMQDCINCHLQNGAGTDCQTCHLDKNIQAQATAGTSGATHGPGWATTHGGGDLRRCSVCHPGDYCAQCHGVPLPHPDDFPAQHGQASLAPQAKCLECHSQKTFCDSCHQGISMPHSAGYLKVHGGNATGYDDPRCLSCHEVSGCTNCHYLHVHPGQRDNGAPIHGPSS